MQSEIYLGPLAPEDGATRPAVLNPVTMKSPEAGPGSGPAIDVASWLQFIAESQPVTQEKNTWTGKRR